MLSRRKRLDFWRIVTQCEYQYPHPDKHCVLTCFTCSEPSERPTAKTLLDHHPFCRPDPTFNFLDTELYHKIRGTF